MRASCTAVCVLIVLGVSLLTISAEDVNLQSGVLERDTITNVGTNLIEPESGGEGGSAFRNQSTGSGSDGRCGELSCDLAVDGGSEDLGNPPHNGSTGGGSDGRSGELPCVLAASVVTDELGSNQPINSSYRVEGGNVSQAIPGRAHRNECIEDVGEKLLLTDLVEAGNISEARDLARVTGGPFPEHIPSYSGFFTVDKRFNSNLFFWFFPCETDYKNAPVLLWLQGGPGDSSLMGLFNEVGPFSVATDGTTLVENPNSWHKDHSLVFIDNPVGAGFSFTDDEDGYATNQTQIGESLYSAMIQFFKLFPELQKNEFFIAGVSYAGKYIPTLGHIIHTRNPNADLKINLKGIAVGNGYTDPISMTELNKLVYQLGLIDYHVRDQMEIVEEAIRKAVEDGDMLTAAREKSFNVQLFAQNARFSYGYNLLHSREPYEEYGFANFFRSADVRRRIHVGDVEFTTDVDEVTRVFHILYPQGMVSVKPYLEALLEHYRVLYYSGQLDILVTYPMSVNMYRSLNWSAAEEYKHARRIPWFVDDDIAWYMKSAGKFTEVLVRKAGHVVPYDQPVWARLLISLFTSDNIPKH